MSKKPILFHQSKPVKACGIIIVQYAEEPYFLLQKRGKLYEDFGGKVEWSDQSVFDTMVREALEESNHRFDASSLYQRLLTTPFFYYHKKANYLYAVIQATEEEVYLIDQDFGEVENHQQVERSVAWIPMSQISFGNVHPRLHTSKILPVK